MTDEQKVKQLREKVDKAQREKQQLEGQLQRGMSDLQENYACASIEQAEQKLKEAQQTHDNLRQNFDIKLKEVEEKYGLSLDEA